MGKIRSMRSLQIELSQDQRSEIRKLLKEHANSWQITKRLEAIRLLDQGLTVSTISLQLCINPDIIYRYIRVFEEEGIQGLLLMQKPGKESKLSEEQLVQLEKLTEECRKQGKKFTTKDQVQWVKENFNIIIGEKWLYKRLLMRKTNRLDKILSLFICLTLLGRELTMRPGYRRMLLFTLHMMPSQIYTLLKG